MHRLSDESILLSNEDLAVEIALLGAELRSIRDSESRQWLWQGDVGWWAARAPILFPVVGRCAGSELRHRGYSFPAEQAHGFARDLAFSVASLEDDSCSLSLASDDSTRARYPFDFWLDMRFTLDGGRLWQTATVTNTGSETMPASFGFHPGFPWPLPSDSAAPQEAYEIIFAEAESAPIRRLANNLLADRSFATPVEDKRLPLSPALFQSGSVIFDRLSSRSLWFGISDQSGIRIDFPDCPHLGLWMLPGASFLCIEPWQGYPCPEGFQGDILEKPGMIHLAPGESFSRNMGISIGSRLSQGPGNRPNGPPVRP
ncbi:MULTISPECIES: aldose 1-epimerase family protein [unclassified Mesorhizobium]|uniref:aldose 1-epimerase family protein n=1 Tax=unclassified Mesorhizobium TaxID=325217 RepID=UPI0015E2A1EC|nr:MULTISPECIES: aldose 1-epimerase family protein [unclassified Mesorhizobium]MBZ9811286.1 aldose 1-epimerase family protein [Mesorhizobium sp. ESP-6-2]